jgi:hypothetical protein
MLGRDPDGAADLERAWNDWAARTFPLLPTDLATAGRDNQVKEVIGWLGGEPSVISVCGDSTEEAFAFIASCLLSLPADERTAVLARTLVVRTPAAWDEVLARAGAESGLVLIPGFPDAAAAEAAGTGHRVAVPLGPNTVTAGTVVKLPQLQTAPARAALVAAGVPDKKASELARTARRSLLTLRRRLAVGASAVPPWAQPGAGGELVPVILAGAWKEGTEADQQVLSRLAGRPYAEISSLCTRWAAEEDMPVRRLGPVWFAVSKADAWDALHRLATSEVIAQFKAVATEVLGTVNPVLALEPSRRWAAGAFGPSLPWSPVLRTSIAETIAVIATQGSDRALPGGGTGEDLAGEIVREVLQAANADRCGQLWSSLSDLLPTLAEAAPAVFLDAVDAGLDSGGLEAVFDPEAESAPFGSPAHTGLLWALEALAWSPEYLGSAALALAGLARVDPGGRWSNRPDRSLAEIFMTWPPQTGAGREERLAVVDRLGRATPDVAWSVLLGLLPTPHMVTHFSYRPRWRDWQPETEPEQMSAAEWSWQAKEVTARLLRDVGLDGHRWADLVERLPYLPLPQHDLVVSHLASQNPDAFAAADRAAVADGLRAVVRAHRRYPDALWAMAPGLVDRIAAQLERFDVSSAPETAWLFAHHVELPGPHPADVEDELRTVQELRDAAVLAITAGGGNDAFWELAEHCEAPEVLGWTAGCLAAELEDASIIGGLDSAVPARFRAAAGWASGRFREAGWPWATPHLNAAAAWPPQRAAAFLLALTPHDAQGFDWADQLGGTVPELYWQGVHPYRIIQTDLERAARTLTDRGHATRALAALTSITTQDGSPDPGLIIDALSAASPAPAPGNDATMFAYYVTSLLEHLDGQPGIDRRPIAMIEWRYLPLLEAHQRPARVLHQELARDPEFFADVIAMVFRPQADSSKVPEPTEEERIRAQLGYQLLRSWRTVPGTGGNPGEPGLAQWVREARDLLTQRRLLQAGDLFIGQVLSQTSEDPDGSWPGLQAREIIEDCRSQDLEQGIDTAVVNGRGVTWRAMNAGGQPERALADKYQRYAQRTGTQWARTRRMLQRMAENWDRRARQEDQLAEDREEFWS